jgi:hypothetical protein
MKQPKQMLEGFKRITQIEDFENGSPALFAKVENLAAQGKLSQALLYSC